MVYLAYLYVCKATYFAVFLFHSLLTSFSKFYYFQYSQPKIFTEAILENCVSFQIEQNAQ